MKIFTYKYSRCSSFPNSGTRLPDSFAFPRSLHTIQKCLLLLYLYLICLFIVTLVFQPIASIESYAAGSEKGRKGNVNQDNTLDSVVCSGQSSLSKRSRKSSTVHKYFLLMTISFHKFTSMPLF